MMEDLYVLQRADRLIGWVDCADFGPPRPKDEAEREMRARQEERRIIRRFESFRVVPASASTRY